MSLQAILRQFIKKPEITSRFSAYNVSSKISRKAYSALMTNTKRNVTLVNHNPMNFTVMNKRMLGDHSKLWPVEKIVTLSLLGVIPADIMNPSLVLDDMLAVLAVLHMHWGLEGVIEDYVRPIILGNTIPKITLGLLYLISIITLGGLFFFNHECIGIGCTIRRFWEIQK